MDFGIRQVHFPGFPISSRGFSESDISWYANEEARVSMLIRVAQRVRVDGRGFN